MTVHLRDCCLVLSVLAYAITSPALAQTQPSVYWGKDEAEPTKPDATAFERSRFDLGFGAQGLTTFSRRSESLGFLTFRASYYLVDSVSVGLELGVAPGNMLDDRYFVRAFDGMLLAQWNFLQAGSFSLYADGGVGALHATRFPTGGRPDSALLGGGLGADWRLAENAHFTVGARYIHLSGGDLFSSQGTRPSDGIQYGIGLMFVR